MGRGCGVAIEHARGFVLVVLFSVPELAIVAVGAAAAPLSAVSGVIWLRERTD